MDFEKYLETGAHQIEQELEEILAELLDDVKKNKPRLLPLALGFINSCRGGKRIRGVLVKLGYEIASGRDHPEGVSLDFARSRRFDKKAHLGGEIIKVGAAYEICHSAILIHDDVIDQSPTRRGQPSFYQALGGDHYGISQAISVGDVGLYLPVKIITSLNFLGEYKIKALNHLSQIVMDTGWGEVLDVELPHLGESSEEDIRLLYLLKTARYTVSGSLQLGAILSGAEEKLIGVLGEFGENLGIAFQIQDDILDSEVGLWGGIENAKKEAIRYKNQAMKIIPELTKDVKVSKLLQHLAEYLVNRSK